MTIDPVSISAYTATSGLGHGNQALKAGLLAQKSGLRPCRFEGTVLPTWIGEVHGLDDAPVRDDLSSFDCRNNRLAQLSLQQDGFESQVHRAIEQYGAHRVGVFVGSSTSGLLEAERAYQRRDPDGRLPADFSYEHTHNMASLGSFVSAWLGTRGPSSVCSVACASSAKVFATAARALALNLIDAAVVGGVDSLCLTTLHGFGSLELLSPQPCRPWDRHRDGISIGEAGAFALLEKDTRSSNANSSTSTQAKLLGYGESSDAYHMSSPHPEGLGARRAMEQALSRAGLSAQQIDYINLHGTATPSNDSAEDAAVFSVFSDTVPASSSKALHGHSLGAAGALEAVVTLLALEHGFIPANTNLSSSDPALRSQILRSNQDKNIQYAMSNSFGFGGANASLVFSQGQP